jgi:hypothetical protein
MKEVEFRVGDNVWCIKEGNGVVVDIRKNKTYIVKVGFESGTIETYSHNGYMFLKDKIRSLYHGHDLEFNVNEKLPERKVKRWINLYRDTKGVYTGGNIFKTKNVAEETAKLGYNFYLKTVEIEIPEKDL